MDLGISEDAIKKMNPPDMRAILRKPSKMKIAADADQQ